MGSSDTRRFDYLASEIERCKPLPDNVRVETYHDQFDQRMDMILRGLGAKPPPVFTFIDPFGISDNHREVTSTALGHRGCEVLVYVPIYDIARHIDAPAFERHLDNLFAGAPWRNAKKLASLQLRIKYLKHVFEEEMAKTCTWVRCMEIRNENPSAGYFLFFGTSHPLGDKKMKEVMWRVDPVNGLSYHPTLKFNNDLLLPVTPGPDVGPLKRQLYERFHENEFSIDEAVAFTLTTSFKETHLKTHTLVPLEAHGGIVVTSASARRRSNTYPSGTLIRFTREPNWHATHHGSSSQASASGERKRLTPAGSPRHGVPGPAIE